MMRASSPALVAAVSAAVLARSGKRHGAELRFTCPAHNDEHPSADWNAGKGGWLCRSCGAHGGAVDLAKRLGVPLPSRNGHARNGKQQPVRETTYPCRDLTGALIAEHVRQEFADGSKKFLWKRNGKWGLDGLPVAEVPLYRTPEVVAAPPAEPVIICEGEKACNSLSEHGFIACATVTGADKCGKTHSAARFEFLRGRDVALWPDNDDTGRVHMNATAQRLRGIARSVRLISWGEQKGDDAHDFFQRGGTADGVRELIARASEPPADAAVEPRTGSPASQQFALTDLGNAERLVRDHGQDLKYSFQESSWFVWDGSRWRRDEHGAVTERAKFTVRQMYADAAKLEDDGERRALAKWARASESRKAVDATVALARSALPITRDQMDTDPMLFSCANGTLDLRTGALREHRRSDYCTKFANVTCDPAARCPTFELFLQRVLPDPDVRDFLQRFFGYALTGDVREDLVVVLCGNGQNGKSTLVDAVIEVMGDYGNAVPSTLLVAEGSAERHPTEVATLRGLRLAATFETEGEHRLREALLKQLTGGDRLTARVMRGDFFTFAPTHKLILSTNHRPRVRGTDTAVWRRLRMVPFAVEISEAEQDKDLGTKLRAEQSGILRWLVEGCLKWQRNGLGAPRAVISATNEYRSSEDAVAMFVAEECLPAAEVIVESKLLYGCFRQWFEKSYPGERAPSKTGFGAELRRRGLRSGKSGARRYWIGLQPAAFQPAAVGEVTSWGEREQLPNLVID